MVQIVVATDDNEIVSSARFKGGFPIPCSHIIDEMQQVALSSLTQSLCNKQSSSELPAAPVCHVINNAL